MMNRRISMFNLDDLNRPTRDVLRQKAAVPNSSEGSDTIIFRIRDRLKDTIGSSAGAQEVLSSGSVEEYFIRSLKLALMRSSSPAERKAFLTLGPLSAAGTGEYAQRLRELLSYYTVFETDLVVNALDNEQR